MADQLRPLFDRLVVKEHKPSEMRESGLLVPATAAEHQIPPQVGTVLAVGPGLDWWASVGMKMPVEPGDTVMWPYSCGVYVDVREERLLVLRVGELLGVVEAVVHPDGVESRGASEQR